MIASSTVFAVLDRLVGAGDTLWRASWQAAVIAVLVAGSQLAFGRRIAPRWRHAMWMLVLVRLAVPVLPSSPLSVFNLAPKPTSPITVTQTIGLEPDFVQPAEPLGIATAHQASSPVRTPDVASVAAAPRGPWQGWPRALAAVWLVGTLALMLRILWATGRVMRILRRLDRVDHQPVLDLLRDTANELRVRRLPTLLTGDGLFSPALVGFLRPRLLVPRELLTQFNPGELRLVFLHELAHMKRRDVAVNWIASLLTAIHWPNPVVWLAAWRLRVERELACDELVLSRTTTDADRRAYGHTIVKLLETFARHGAARPMPAGAVGILEGKEQMKRRITMIARFAKQSRLWTALAAVLVITLGVVALTDAVGAEPKEDAAPPTTSHDRRQQGLNDPALIERTARSDYEIKEGDVIMLKVTNPSAPAGTKPENDMFIVTPKGITLPNVKGEVAAIGKTADQLKQDLTDAIAKASGARLSIEMTLTPVTRPTQRGVVQIDDLIAVSIMDLAGPGVETTKTSRIDADGKISLPYVGLVKIDGLTPNEVEKAIAKAYSEQGLIEHPVIAVSRPDRGESHRLTVKGDVVVNQTPAPAAPREDVSPAVRAQLGRTLPEVNFEGVGLSDVLDFLRDVTSMNIAVDWRGLEALGVERNAPVTMKLNNVEFGEVMKILLHDVNPALRFDIEGNVLRITADQPAPRATTRPATGKLERRTYDITDLLNINAAQQKQELIETILQNVQPDVWRTNGGSASVTTFGVNLIVTAPADVHHEVEELLRMLRKTVAALPDGATLAEKMTPEMIADVDAEMAQGLKARDALKLQIEKQKAKGVQDNHPSVKALTDELAGVNRVINGRADSFFSKYKGFYYTPDKKMTRLGSR